MQIRPTQVTTNPGQEALQYGMMGNSLGSNFGPKGAAVGAAAGLIYGGVMGVHDQQQQRQANANDIAANKAFAANPQVDLSQQYRTPPQARNGMKSNRYLQVEIEGDGSGSKNGGGEIVTDKHYNIKKNATGAPTHEQGGSKVTIGKGDIVFPTQNKNDHTKILSAIQSLKLKKDNRAKAFLDKVANDLPGTADYDNGKLSNGYKEPDYIANQAAFRKFTPVKGAGGYDYYKDPTSGLLMYNDLKTGAPVRPTESQYGAINNQEFGGRLGPYVQGQTPSSGETKPFIMNTNTPTLKTSTFPTGVNKGGAGGVGMSTSPSFPNENVSRLNKVGDAIGGIGSYMNVAHNLIEGSKPSEKVQRRVLTADQQRYTDLSQPQRNAIAEARNYQVQASGNNVNSAVSQGRQSQASAQAVGQTGEVNAREAAAQREIMARNIDTNNQVRGANLQLQNQYDELDAQNRAVSQAYKGTAFKEGATLADIGSQRRYMKSKDDKEYEMDKLRYEGTSSKNYGTKTVNGKLVRFTRIDGKDYDSRTGQLI
jgi:hypothetical protein